MKKDLKKEPKDDDLESGVSVSTYQFMNPL